MRNAYSWAMLAAIVSLVIGWHAFAAQSKAPQMSNHDLQQQVSTLSEQVALLKKEVANLEAIKPTFTEFMPNFSERFHVMHLAGDAGDWAVAGHEIAELQRLLSVAKAVDAQKGQLMESFIGNDLQEIQEAIEHADSKKFDTLLGDTVKQCNACHAAVQSPFIKVGLNVHDILSYRHSHLLQRSKPMAHHHHGAGDEDAHGDGHMDGHGDEHGHADEHSEPHKN